VIARDDVFTTFVRDELPVGLAGVMVAAIFAASMSSIDSTVHSMATATLVDFVARFRRTPLPDEGRTRVAKRLTLVYGVLAIGAAFYAKEQGRDVLDLLLGWLGRLAGPILGLFLLGMLTRRVREVHAVTGLVAGYVAVVALFSNLLGTAHGADGKAISPAQAAGWSWIWAASAGCAVTMGVACGLALAGRRRNP